MIKTIVHLSDLHFRTNPGRLEEYRQVCENALRKIQFEKPSRIVISGDINHDQVDISTEQSIIVRWFLGKLAEIAPVIVTRGNHDFTIKNQSRTDAVTAFVDGIDNITYYNKTGLYEDENVIWAVWHHGDRANKPYENRSELSKTKTVIDIYHDPINGSTNADGHVFNKKSYRKVSDFQGDYGFFGDIHKMQMLGNNGRRAYAGSLIAQDYSEGNNEFHGFLKWDIELDSCTPIPVENEYSFKDVIVTSFTDFDDLDLEIENPTKFMRVRIVWKTYPAQRTTQTERSIKKYLTAKYPTQIKELVHKNLFIEEKKMDIEKSTDFSSLITSEGQEKIMRRYLEKIGCDDLTIKNVIEIDEEVTSLSNIEQMTGIIWDIVSVKGKNFMSYDDLVLDFSDVDGIIQILGNNTAGKTTLIKLISYLLYGVCAETEEVMKNGDSRFVNNKNGATFTRAEGVIDANNEYFGIVRQTTINKNKKGEISGSPTTLTYHKLKSPNEPITDENCIENLSEKDRMEMQKKLATVIGTYDNFKRIVSTTASTLNNIISATSSEFIDSVMKDSGMTIFEEKSKGFKAYEAKYKSLDRVICDLKASEKTIESNKETIVKNQETIQNIENVDVISIKKDIDQTKQDIEKLSGGMAYIEQDIYNLNIENEIRDKSRREETIKNIRDIIANNAKIIEDLPTSFDEKELDILNQNIQLKNKDLNGFSRRKSEIDSEINSLNNNNRFVQNTIDSKSREGSKSKEEYLSLKASLEGEKCPLCGSANISDECKKDIEGKMGRIKNDMFSLKNEIENNLQPQIPANKAKIESLTAEKNEILQSEANVINECNTLSAKLGELNLIRNSFIRRNNLMMENNNNQLKIDNENLTVSHIQSRIDRYTAAQDRIKANKDIEVEIDKFKATLKNQEYQLMEKMQEIAKLNMYNTSLNTEILNTEKLIARFKEQEIRDGYVAKYKECIHRNGIPSFVLSEYILPRINSALVSMLESSPYNVWLEEDTFKVKFAYKSIPDAVINARSASGKERTFAAIALKSALNLVNAKSKPMFAMMDEVTGTLINEGTNVEEFIALVQIIKSYCSKLFIIEHNHNLYPDNVISVVRSENGISTCTPNW